MKPKQIINEESCSSLSGFVGEGFSLQDALFVFHFSAVLREVPLAVKKKSKIIKGQNSCRKAFVIKMKQGKRTGEINYWL